MVYPILFLMFQYNFIETFIKIMEHHIAVEHNRDYFVGLFYAPFDFYLFLGIPITILVFTRIYRFFKDIRFSKSSTLLKQESVVTAYVIFLTAVILSGSVRLESARIWIPFIPLALIIASSEIKQRKITSQQFLSMLLLLFIQVILFQSILVTVW